MLIYEPIREKIYIVFVLHPLYVANIHSICTHYIFLTRALFLFSIGRTIKITRWNHGPISGSKRLCTKHKLQRRTGNPAPPQVHNNHSTNGVRGVTGSKYAMLRPKELVRGFISAEIQTNTTENNRPAGLSIWCGNALTHTHALTITYKIPFYILETIIQYT